MNRRGTMYIILILGSLFFIDCHKKINKDVVIEYKYTVYRDLDNFKTVLSNPAPRRFVGVCVLFQNNSSKTKVIDLNAIYLSYYFDSKYRKKKIDKSLDGFYKLEDSRLVSLRTRINGGRPLIKKIILDPKKKIQIVLEIMPWVGSFERGQKDFNDIMNSNSSIENILVNTKIRKISITGKNNNLLIMDMHTTQNHDRAPAAARLGNGTD